jgi:hypothetical protein
MTAQELSLIENQVYTKILIEEFRKQRKEGIIDEKDFLIDKYAIDKLTNEKLRKVLEELSGHIVS